MDWSYPLRAACERTPRGIAVRCRGQELTFAELEARTLALAHGLAALGAAGRTVAWVLPNVPEAIELSMALARVGAVGVPVNARLGEDERAFILRDAGAQLLVVAHDALPAARAFGARVAGLDAVVAVEALPHDGDPAADWAVADDRLATLMYTSGTTGVPKGVMRTHRANAWNVVDCALGSPRRPGDVELFTLPAFGIGLLHFALPALLGGATVVLDREFDAARTWELLVDERVTRTFLAPTMVSAMLAVEDHERHDLAALEQIATAYELSERLRLRALERFGDRFVPLYGLTEAQLTTGRVGDLSAKPGSVGRTMGAMRLRILGDDGAALPAGEVGEIALEGPATMSGYHGRPEETAASLRDGWVLTGDLGRLDADGDLHYVGRRKEMIKTGGFSVDPREVEDALLTLAGVVEAAVVGVPDDHWGEMVVAFAVPGDGAPDEAAVIAACRERLAGYRVPKRVRFLDALPVNATGKVERGALRERYAREREREPTTR